MSLPTFTDFWKTASSKQQPAVIVGVYAHPFATPVAQRQIDHQYVGIANFLGTYFIVMSVFTMLVKLSVLSLGYTEWRNHTALSLLKERGTWATRTATRH